MLALFQFDTKSWLNYPSAAIMCLALSGIWMVILTEAGLRVGVAVAVGLGGWVFCMLNLLQFRTLCKLVAPNEYVFATLFILFPQALLILSSSKKRHPSNNENKTKASVEYDGVSNVI